jgi:methyltransferase (TIGR00027 family)
MSEEPVRRVSDTAFLAAGWRALESSRTDALFNDPLAARLAGKHGLRVAQTLPKGTWVVAMRTILIDSFLLSAISSGIRTIINIGAGFDTRPYRMQLPSSLRWFEIDEPGIIERKIQQLRGEAPACSVERFGLDPADRIGRRELLGRIGRAPTRTMALTEGVIGYLTVDDAGGLADDLHELASVERWLTDYWSPRLLRAYQRHQPLAGAPIRFDPTSCEAFFTERGWTIAEIRYLGEESRRLHRPVPLPLSDKAMRLFTSRPLRDMGFADLRRSG